MIYLHYLLLRSLLLLLHSSAALENFYLFFTCGLLHLITVSRFRFHCCRPHNLGIAFIRYDYQVTPGNQCGGADIWSAVSESMNTFCAAGMYCPTPVENLNCSSGHFCRLGSTVQEKCSQLTSCSKVGLDKQNLTSIGGLILVSLCF
jgi:hypothetical protein